MNARIHKTEKSPEAPVSAPPVRAHRPAPPLADVVPAPLLDPLASEVLKQAFLDHAAGSIPESARPTDGGGQSPTSTDTGEASAVSAAERQRPDDSVPTPTTIARDRVLAVLRELGDYADGVLHPSPPRVGGPVATGSTTDLALPGTPSRWSASIGGRWFGRSPTLAGAYGIARSSPDRGMASAVLSDGAGYLVVPVLDWPSTETVGDGVSNQLAFERSVGGHATRLVVSDGGVWWPAASSETILAALTSEVRSDAPTVREAPDEEHAEDESSLWRLIKDVLLGDFAEDPSTAAIVIRGVLSMIPLIDQAADLQDLVANLKALIWDRRYNEVGPWLGFFITLIGLVPVVGSAVKGVGKLLLKKGDDLAQIALEFLAKRLPPVDLAYLTTGPEKALEWVWTVLLPPARTAASRVMGLVSHYLQRAADSWVFSAPGLHGAAAFLRRLWRAAESVRDRNTDMLDGAATEFWRRLTGSADSRLDDIGVPTPSIPTAPTVHASPSETGTPHRAGDVDEAPRADRAEEPEAPRTNASDELEAPQAPTVIVDRTVTDVGGGGAGRAVTSPGPDHSAAFRGAPSDLPSSARPARTLHRAGIPDTVEEAWSRYLATGGTRTYDEFTDCWDRGLVTRFDELGRVQWVLRNGTAGVRDRLLTSAAHKTPRDIADELLEHSKSLRLFQAALSHADVRKILREVDPELLARLDSGELLDEFAQAALTSARGGVVDLDALRTAYKRHVKSVLAEGLGVKATTPEGLEQSLRVLDAFQHANSSDYGSLVELWFQARARAAGQALAPQVRTTIDDVGRRLDFVDASTGRALEIKGTREALSDADVEQVSANVFAASARRRTGSAHVVDVAGARVELSSTRLVMLDAEALARSMEAHPTKFEDWLRQPEFSIESFLPGPPARTVVISRGNFEAYGSVENVVAAILTGDI